MSNGAMREMPFLAILVEIGVRLREGAFAFVSRVQPAKARQYCIAGIAGMLSACSARGENARPPQVRVESW